MTAWLGIFINLLPLIVFFGLFVGLIKFARVRPRYELEGPNLVVTYNRRGSDVVALDRATRVVRGRPLGTSSFRSPVFIDMLDADGRLLMRFASPYLSLSEFRALLGPLRNQLPAPEVTPEVEAIVRGTGWPRSSFQRLLPFRGVRRDWTVLRSQFPNEPDQRYANPLTRPSALAA